MILFEPQNPQDKMIGVKTRWRSESFPLKVEAQEWQVALTTKKSTKKLGF